MVGGEDRDRGIDVRFSDDGDQATTHVEDLPHLVLRDLAKLTDQRQHRRHWQRSFD